MAPLVALLFATLVSGACLSAEDLQALEISPLQRHPLHDRIVLERDWWNGHYLTTEIGRILLEEAMGFPVVIRDYMGSTSFVEMTAGRTDINLEVWVRSQVGSISQANIANAGPTGIIGRVGLYYPDYMMENYSSWYLELWRSYQRESELTALFPRPETVEVTVPGREFVPPQCVLNVTPAGCNIYGPDFDNYLCNVTEINQDCMTVWSYDFTWDGAWIHQQIRNLGLNWTVSHMYDYTPTVAAAVAVKQPFIVYSWAPNQANTMYGLERLTFPEITPACVRKVGAGQDGIGSVDCDFEIQVILKIVSERLSTTESLAQAAQFARAFTLTTQQQELIMDELGGIDPNPIWGTDPTSTMGQEIACNWVITQPRTHPYRVKNNTDIWRNWIVNIPPAPLPYLTFWYNASIVALFFTALAWPVGIILCLYRRGVHPLALVPRNDLLLGLTCPLFALFVPIGVQSSWVSVGCYSSLWMLTLVTPISFIAPLFVSHSVVIEVFLQDLRSAVVLKRITNAAAMRRLAILRVLKNVWCQVLFSLITLLVSVFVILGVNSETSISNEDEVCTLDKSWRTTMLIELVFYVVIVFLLAPTLLKAAHRRAFFVTIFPMSFLFMAVAVSAMYQTNVMTTAQNPFSFNAVFGLHWLVAVLVYMTVVLNPALRTLGSCKLNRNARGVTETDVELSLTVLLDSAVGFRHFVAFAREQFCEENLLALRAVYRFGMSPSAEEMDKIYEKCINRSSLFAINISSDCFAKCETFQHSVHFENFMAELEDKEESATNPFKRIKSRRVDRQSGVELSGSKHTDEHGSQAKESIPAKQESQVDFLGLPASFTTRSKGKGDDSSRHAKEPIRETTEERKLSIV